MKTKLLLLASLICLFGFNTACNDSNINTKNENNLQEGENSLVGTWICVPELHPYITITLSIDSENIVYVNTNPKELYYIYDTNVSMPYTYFFCDNVKFKIKENNMYLYNDATDSFLTSHTFEITKISNDTMELKFVEGYTLDNVTNKVFEYIFRKK